VLLCCAKKKRGNTPVCYTPCIDVELVGLACLVDIVGVLGPLCGVGLECTLATSRVDCSGRSVVRAAAKGITDGFTFNHHGVVCWLDLCEGRPVVRNHPDNAHNQRLGSLSLRHLSSGQAVRVYSTMQQSHSLQSQHVQWRSAFWPACHSCWCAEIESRCAAWRPL
jgi:hypothetical protein